jgi:hypothetical protein
METQTMSALPAPIGFSSSTDLAGEIVEIALLLPKKRADALVQLSREKHQSVGQILRSLIDRALLEAQ